MSTLSFLRAVCNALVGPLHSWYTSTTETLYTIECVHKWGGKLYNYLSSEHLNKHAQQFFEPKTLSLSKASSLLHVQSQQKVWWDCKSMQSTRAFTVCIKLNIFKLQLMHHSSSGLSSKMCDLQEHSMIKFIAVCSSKAKGLQPMVKAKTKVRVHGHADGSQLSKATDHQRHTVKWPDAFIPKINNCLCKNNCAFSKLPFLTPSDVTENSYWNLWQSFESSSTTHWVLPHKWMCICTWCKWQCSRLQIKRGNLYSVNYD